MYTKALRNDLLNLYAMNKSIYARKYQMWVIWHLWSLIGFLRFQYPHDYKKPVLKTQFPGPQHMEALVSADAAQSVDATQRA